MRPRDSQRLKLYRAENVLLEDGDKLETVVEIQAYCNRLVGSAWWKRRWPRVSMIDVRDGRRRRSACGIPRGYYGVIKMPKDSRHRYIVIHEVAHIVQPPGTAWHGREFAMVFLELVRHLMGDESWRKLKDSFRKHKVKHTARRSGHRGGNPEALAKAREARRVKREAGIVPGV